MDTKKDKMEKNVVYNEDMMKTLKGIPDGCVDMVFADPPFNLNKKYKGYKDEKSNYYEWQAEWIKECFRILKNTGTFYLMTMDDHLPYTLNELSKHGIFINIIKWGNMSASHNKRAFWKSTQPIAMYAKSDEYIFNTYAETKPIFISWDKQKTDRARGQLRDYWDDIPYVYAGSIIHKEAIIKPGTSGKAHLAQMPENLVGRAIKFSTNEGGIIYDPFIGSGTTAIAALKLQRYYIGSEISEEYYDLINERIKEYHDAGSLL